MKIERLHAGFVVTTEDGKRHAIAAEKPLEDFIIKQVNDSLMEKGLFALTTKTAAVHITVEINPPQHVQ